jgi:cyanophycinase
MARAGPLQWLTGGGWLVLVGNGSPSEELAEHLLARADFARPIGFLPAAGGDIATGERLLEEYAALGGPSGYVVPIFTPTDAEEEENRHLLADAGIIFIGDGDASALAHALAGTAALRGMMEAFVRGALVVGLGAGAAPLGERVIFPDISTGRHMAEPVSTPGWGWIRGTVIVPRFHGATHSPRLRALLHTWPGLLGIGIPEGTALALGPNGEVETWGSGEITVIVAR